MTATPPEVDDGADAAVAALDTYEAPADPAAEPIPSEILNGTLDADDDPDPDDEGTTDDGDDPDQNDPDQPDHLDANTTGNWFVRLIQAIAGAFGGAK